jgi:hypothetical protein
MTKWYKSTLKIIMHYDFINQIILIGIKIYLFLNAMRSWNIY